MLQRVDRVERRAVRRHHGPNDGPNDGLTLSKQGRRRLLLSRNEGPGGPARRDSAEHFSRLGALLFTALAWIFIPAYCSAHISDRISKQCFAFFN